jgi:SAM-dependent methyltransferase
MVSVRSMENALPYLTCTDGCDGDLEPKGIYLENGLKDIARGRLLCSCGREYAISGGIPYFFDFAESRGKGDVADLRSEIAAYAEEGNSRMCLDGFNELAKRLSETLGSDLEAIKEIFRFETNLVRGMNEKNRAAVSQAATTARYNLERYRGCYTLPENVVRGIQESAPDGIIFEGAMATGENLVSIEKMSGRIAIGIDLSDRMVGIAQERSRGDDRIFVAQGNLECVPVKSGASGLVLVNNLFDRAPDPMRIAGELDRISAPGSMGAIFNCSPLQFVSPDGVKVYVPENRRMTLEEVTVASGFEPVQLFGVSDIPPWDLETIFDGRERLPMEGVAGIKPKYCGDICDAKYSVLERRRFEIQERFGGR